MSLRAVVVMGGNKEQVSFLQKRNPIRGLQYFEKYLPAALKKKN